MPASNKLNFEELKAAYPKDKALQLASEGLCYETQVDVALYRSETFPAQAWEALLDDPAQSAYHGFAQAQLDCAGKLPQTAVENEIVQEAAEAAVTNADAAEQANEEPEAEALEGNAQADGVAETQAP